MRRAAEIVLLVAVCYLAFFANLHRRGFIKTEALRAVVVSEMLERDGLTMPTVHETPYLKKPPLYAWTTTLTARAVGRFDEQIARLPSAIFGTLFVLLMYGLAEKWIGCGAGLVAGVFTLLCPTIADYAVRAELDLPFSFFCTVNLALTLTALRASGWRASAWWIAAYAAALIAAMWKGPHSLIFMWLCMTGHALMNKDRSFLRQPAQWIGLAVNLGVLIWWACALAAFAGPSRVERAAGVELFIRLVPHRVGNFVSMLYFPALLAVITLPAAAFFLLTLRADVRSLCGLTAGGGGSVGTGNDEKDRRAEHQPLGAWRSSLSAWWIALRSSPLSAMLLTWFVPLLLFMMWAPAKSPRYSIPIFAPVILLGAWVALLLDAARGTDVARHATRIWRAMFSLFALGGLLGCVRVVAGLAGKTFGLGTVDAWMPWLVLGLGCSLPIVFELSRRGGCSLRIRLVLSLLAFVSLQPVVQQVWWPYRAEADSQASICDTIRETTSPEEYVYVLGRREFPDTQIGSKRQFLFVGSIDEALQLSGGDRAYAVAREEELEELTQGAAARYEIIRKFQRADHTNVFIRIVSP